MELENEKEMGKNVSSLSCYSPIACCPLSSHFQRERPAGAGLKDTSQLRCQLRQLRGAKCDQSPVPPQLFVYVAAFPQPRKKGRSSRSNYFLALFLLTPMVRIVDPIMYIITLETLNYVSQKPCTFLQRMFKYQSQTSIDK